MLMHDGTVKDSTTDDDRDHYAIVLVTYRADGSWPFAILVLRRSCALVVKLGQLVLPQLI